jgi:transposase
MGSRERNRPRSSFLLFETRALSLDVMRMQSHELLREVFEKCSAKEISSELGLSLSLIYKWAEPPDEAAGSGAANPLDRIEALYRCSQDVRIVEWICQRAGGFFIRNPDRTNAHPDFLIPATNQIVQEFADLLAVIATAAADNQINSAEAKTIRARWEELKSVTECFVACCEKGNFQPLKEKTVPPRKN